MRGATISCNRLILSSFVFQSTHPMRGATYIQSGGIFGYSISIHAPHAGCDSTYPRFFPLHFNFNPRTPCGVRRSASASFRSLLKISIHAPHAGCDFSTAQEYPGSSADFNPRTPCGVRHAAGVAHDEMGGISIHAPHAGCDRRPKSSRRWQRRFQSTHPMRGATDPSGDIDLFQKFQSTHPMRGATREAVGAA